MTAGLFGNSNPLEEKQHVRICFAGRKHMAGSVCITHILHLMSMSGLCRPILLRRESYLPSPFDLPQIHSGNGGSNHLIKISICNISQLEGVAGVLLF